MRVDSASASAQNGRTTPIDVNWLATFTVKFLIERPDDGVTLSFAPDLADTDCRDIESAIRAEATGAGLLIGITLRCEPERMRLVVTRLDHRRRPGRQASVSA